MLAFLRDEDEDADETFMELSLLFGLRSTDELGRSVIVFISDDSLILDRIAREFELFVSVLLKLSVNELDDTPELCSRTDDDNTDDKMVKLLDNKSFSASELLELCSAVCCSDDVGDTDEDIPLLKEVVMLGTLDKRPGDILLLDEISFSDILELDVDCIVE